MSLKLWDFECKKCGIFEDIIESEEDTTTCKCGAEVHKIFTPSGLYLGNQDAPWIRTVLDVVDKDDKSPHVQEFVKNPTRDNYHRWMKKEGIRPLDTGHSRHGEEYYNKQARQEQENTHVARMTDAVMKMRQKNRRIEVG